MLVVAYLMCRIMKAKKDFIRVPAKLTLIGAVLLPLISSFNNVVTTMSSPDVSTRTDFHAALIKGLDTMESEFMFIVPALLCAIASIMLTVGMINILRNRYIGR